MLATANSPDVNLCKTIISAILAGYPTPTLINWAQTKQDEYSEKGNSHIAKVSGVREYLRKQSSARDEDLVLVVDGYDIWFQLSPQILIERYHELCRRADKQLEERLGARAVEEMNIRQRILFTAQKECWPGGDEDLNCYAVPNSTLPKDIYGPDTDTLIDDLKNPSLRVRQRYMSSGIVIGPLAELRRLYDRAMSEYSKNNKLASDQSLFSRIYGEQEYQREVIRYRYSSWNQNWKLWAGQYVVGMAEPSILDPHPTRLKMEPGEGAEYDFGVFLDYTSAVGQATVFAEYDADWVVFNDTATIVEAYDRMNTSKPGAHLISEDVADSLPPFWTTTRIDTSIPQDVTWADVMLFTNLYTGITPAIIHHNAHRDNLKALREGVWDRMWFQPYIRDLLKARLHEPYLPVAVSGVNGHEKAWWGPTEKRSLGLGAQPDTSSSEWLQWEDIVDDDWAEELFRDGKGPWKESG